MTYQQQFNVVLKAEAAEEFARAAQRASGTPAAARKVAQAMAAYDAAIAAMQAAYPCVLRAL